MDFKSITEILKLVNKSDLTEVGIEEEGFKLKIKRKSEETQTFYHRNAILYLKKAVVNT